MARFIDMLEHPSHLMSSRRASRFARRASKAVRQRPGGSIMGLVALVVLVVGFIWLFPELQRYIKMERM